MIDETLTLGEQANDPLKNTFEELGPHFEEHLLRLATSHAKDQQNDDVTPLAVIEVEQTAEFNAAVSFAYPAATTASLIVALSSDEALEWHKAYAEDTHFQEVLCGLVHDEQDTDNSKDTPIYPQYHRGEMS